MSFPYFNISAGQKKRFREKLIAWYSEHARDLPWRNTNDPYAILVSEMMLQQTQVDRVIPKYEQWMKQFPTVEKLATAPRGKIIESWQGLGYNRRALFLQKCAQTVVAEYGGTFPQTREELLQLPGIGPYTAGALLSFAFHKGEAIVDTNVERVLGRVFIGYQKLRDLPEEVLWELSTAMVPKRATTTADPYRFNQALMDFGAMQCKLTKPECGTCPFQRTCLSYPEITEAAPADLRYKKKVEEKKYFGKPRRIWRGRILKYLHSAPGGKARLQQIGYAIQEDYEDNREEWLQSVVDSLEKDELLNQKGGFVCLP